MRLNQVGTVVAAFWGEIPKHFPNVTLDEFVVTPNHLHGILLLGDEVAGHARPTPRSYRAIRSNTTPCTGTCAE